MDIIFDREELAKWGKPDDPNNTPEKLIERRESDLRKLGEFCNADSIEYKDIHKGEVYILRRGKERIRLNISGTAIDGGWMNIEKE